MLSRLGLGSMTYAVMAQNFLASDGVSSHIVKLAPNESKHGCAYGLETKSDDIKKAMRILKNRRVNFTLLG